MLGLGLILECCDVRPDMSTITSSKCSEGTVLNGSGQITHVIDGVGMTASKANGGKLNPVISYP